LSVPPDRLPVLENKERWSKMTTLEKLEELGFSIQDNICVFCSRTMDRWDRVCVSCKEYKGVMNIVDAVEYYGKDILSC
jgi:hypothetical protein